MKKVILLLFFLLSACATLKIVPQAQTGSQVDQESLAVTREIDNISVTVRLADVSVRPAPIEQNYCSFWIEINNQRSSLLPISFKDFTLVDAEGYQYAAHEPAGLVALLKPEVPYLVPFPYVGYYYLGDAERGSAADQFRSKSSFATSRRPELIELEALPEDQLLPHSKVAGKIYFSAELRTMRSFNIHYQVGALPGQKTFPFNFSFSVEKN